MTTTTLTKLLYLCHTEGFNTHGGVVGLQSMEWHPRRCPVSKSPCELVPPVYNVAARGGFPGLFVDQLPDHPCTSPDGQYLFAMTNWGFRTRVVRVLLEDGGVSAVLFDLWRVDGDGGNGDGDGMIAQRHRKVYL